jgi:hypothetical protein
MIIFTQIQKLILDQSETLEFYTDISSGLSGIRDESLSLLCYKPGFSVPAYISIIRSNLSPSKSNPLNRLGFSHQNIENNLLIYNGKIYCNHKLSIALMEEFAKNNFYLRKILETIQPQGFNEWVAQITGWKNLYRRFEDCQNLNSYQERMENAYKLVRDKAFLESCLNK